MDCHVATLLAETTRSCRCASRRDNAVIASEARQSIAQTLRCDKDYAVSKAWTATSLHSSQRLRGHVATLLAETLIYDRHLFKITITADAIHIPSALR